MKSWLVTRLPRLAFPALPPTADIQHIPHKPKSVKRGCGLAEMSTTTRFTLRRSQKILFLPCYIQKVWWLTFKGNSDHLKGQHLGWNWKSLDVSACSRSSSTVMGIHSCYLYVTRPHPVCAHTHKKNFVLPWPPPLLVFILICMRGVHREVSRAYWSCASSVKHTWTCKTTGTQKQHGAEWGTRQSGGWTHQHFKLSNGWGKKKNGLTSRTPCLPKTVSKIKEQSTNKCTIVSDVCRERWWFISILIYVHTLGLY